MADNLIFGTDPDTWQDLESMICQAFEEMWYESRRNYEVSTARGRVSVDVHAVKRSSPIPTVLLCECKYWNRPVDQNVVLSFRSVCNDVGAHYGIIIAKSGFQSGAKASSEYTNIRLLSFDGFQAEFFEEWKSGVFMKFAQMTDRLLTPLLECQPRLAFTKYEVFFGRRRYTSILMSCDGFSRFPIKITDPRGNPAALNTIVVRSFREFFEISKEGYEDACRHFGI